MKPDIDIAREAEARPVAGIAQRLGIPENPSGVVIASVAPGSPAAQAGLQRGDVIVKLNNRDVENAKAFRQLVEELPSGRSVPVLVLRRSGPLFLALRVPKD